MDISCNKDLRKDFLNYILKDFLKWKIPIQVDILVQIEILDAESVTNEWAICLAGILLISVR